MSPARRRIADALPQELPNLKCMRLLVESMEFVQGRGVMQLLHNKQMVASQEA